MNNDVADLHGHWTATVASDERAAAAKRRGILADAAKTALTAFRTNDFSKVDIEPNQVNEVRGRLGVVVAAQEAGADMAKFSEELKIGGVQGFNVVTIFQRAGQMLQTGLDKQLLQGEKYQNAAEVLKTEPAKLLIATAEVA